MFDPSAPHIIILLVVVLLLFGAGRLPGAAEALGKSMRVFKRETSKLHEDDEKAAPQPAVQVVPVSPAPAVAPQPVAAAPATAQPASMPSASTEAQLAELQRQLAELRGATAAQPAPAGTARQAH